MRFSRQLGLTVLVQDKGQKSVLGSSNPSFEAILRKADAG